MYNFVLLGSGQATGQDIIPVYIVGRIARQGSDRHHDAD